MPACQSDIQLGGDSLREARRGEIDALLQDGKRLLRDFEAHVQRALIDIGAGDLADQRNQDCIAHRRDRLGVGFRAFHFAAITSEQINLPGGIEPRGVGDLLEAGGVLRGMKRSVNAAANRVRAGPARCAGAEIELGQGAPADDIFLRSRFLQAHEGDAKIEIIRDGALDEGVEFGIAEGFPPGGQINLRLGR